MVDGNRRARRDSDEVRLWISRKVGTDLYVHVIRSIDGGISDNEIRRKKRPAWIHTTTPVKSTEAPSFDTANDFVGPLSRTFPTLITRMEASEGLLTMVVRMMSSIDATRGEMALTETCRSPGERLNATRAVSATLRRVVDPIVNFMEKDSKRGKEEKERKDGRNPLKAEKPNGKRYRIYSPGEYFIPPHPCRST